MLGNEDPPTTTHAHTASRGEGPAGPSRKMTQRDTEEGRGNEVMAVGAACVALFFKKKMAAQKVGGLKGNLN